MLKRAEEMHVEIEGEEVCKRLQFYFGTFSNPSHFVRLREENIHHGRKCRNV